MLSKENLMAVRGVLRSWDTLEINLVFISFNSSNFSLSNCSATILCLILRFWMARATSCTISETSSTSSAEYLISDFLAPRTSSPSNSSFSIMGKES